MNRVKHLAPVVMVLATAGCASNGFGCGCPPPVPPALTVSPSSLALNPNLAFFPSPAPLMLGPRSLLSNNIVVRSTHAELFDAYLSPADPTGATLLVSPVGAITSPLQVDVMERGSTAILTITSQPCGRPDFLAGAQLLDPPSGATSVPVSTASIYVSGSAPVAISTPGPYAPPGRLHFVMRGPSLGADDTPVRGSSLTYATPPPGSSTPAPPPNTNTYYGVSAMPALTAGYTYDVYLYDDACEAPFLAGSFST